MSDSPGRSSRALASARVGVQALRTNPMRTLLATLGVIIGVAALVAVLSLGDGMESYVRSQVSRTTSVQNVLVIPVTADTVDGILVARARPRLVGLGDVADAERSLPRAAAIGVSYNGTTLVQPAQGGRPRAARVTAATASLAEMYGVKPAAGRFFTRAEVEANAPVVVISHKGGEALSPTGKAEDAVGRTVKLRGTDVRIVGVAPAEAKESGIGVYVPLGLGDFFFDPDDPLHPDREEDEE